MSQRKSNEEYLIDDEEDFEDYKGGKVRNKTKRRNQHSIIKHATEDYLSGVLSEDDFVDWLDENDHY
jgi:hypothetical protein